MFFIVFFGACSQFSKFLHASETQHYGKEDEFKFQDIRNNCIKYIPVPSDHSRKHEQRYICCTSASETAYVSCSLYSASNFDIFILSRPGNKDSKPLIHLTPRFSQLEYPAESKRIPSNRREGLMFNVMTVLALPAFCIPEIISVEDSF
jgi:hypothetical protein